MSKKTYAMAIRDTLSSEMERDERVFVMGEDVEVLGGIFGCTRGLADKFGVRIENTLLVIPYKETEFGKFLQFESLTLCPIDKAPIIKEMLLQEEIDWLNGYHQRVFETLSSELNSDEKEWLRVACEPL